MIKQDKEQMRQEARARRASIPGALRLKAAEALTLHIDTCLPQLSLEPHTLIGCYLAMGTEINTSPVLRCLQRLGFSLALPRTVAPSSPLEFVPWGLNDPLMQDILGFPTPTGAVGKTPPATLLVPLVAFDRNGGRIGQGSGLYDRSLKQLRRYNPDLPVIGLAFSCQEVPEVPCEEHDQRLNLVITEQGVINVGGQNGLKTAKKLDQAVACL